VKETAMSTTDPDVPGPARPQLLDLVRARNVLEPHREHPGVVIDILQQPRIKDGEKYRVRFRGGITEWFWRDELTVLPWAAERDKVHTDLAAIRTIVHHAITVTEGRHDLLHLQLGELFDTVTAIASTYLGSRLGTLAPTAPAD
jgi:hypothetical protein